MTALDHVNGVQLSMFMAPHELARLPMGDDDGSGKREMMERKLREAHQRPGQAHGGGVGPSVQEQGVHTPITVYHGDSEGPFLSDGHHRLASALHHRPGQEVPIQHQDEDNYDSISDWSGPRTPRPQTSSQWAEHRAGLTSSSRSILQAYGNR